LTWIEGGNKPL